MNRAEVYPWVGKLPARRRPLPPIRPSRRQRRQGGRVYLDGPCVVCGWAPMAWFKRCPACLSTVPR